MVWIAYVAIVVAVGWFLYKAYVAVNGAYGADFEIPIYDAAVYPPILFVIGLFFVAPNHGFEIEFRYCVAIWMGLTAVIVGILKVLEVIGERRL